MSYGAPYPDELLSIEGEYLALRLQWAQVAHDFYRRKYDPAQPRIPAGSTGAGRWARLFGSVGGSPAIVALKLGLSLALAIRDAYNVATALNDENNRAAALFRSKEYPLGDGVLNRAEVRNLDKDEAQSFCPRLAEVQSRTDSAAEAVRRDRGPLSPAQYGTAVHLDLKQQIDDLNNPDFRAELSYLKGEPAKYGVRGTIRIDVLERVDAATVCVYDIKTGASGLTGARMDEIAVNVAKNFGPIQRIVITEVRPAQ